jgi:TonB family protein
MPFRLATILACSTILGSAQKGTAFMSRFTARFLLLCWCGLIVAHAQEPLQVTAKMIQEHADHRTFPTYPPIAKAARVQGSVALELRIGINGKIESLKVVSGPAMLQQAAIDCMKQWTFHPFEKNGVPIAATGQYNLIFTLGDQSNTTIGQGSPSSALPPSSAPVKTETVHVLSDNAATGPDEALNNKFNDADNACKKGALSRQFNDATVSSCKNAAELAEQLPEDGNYIARRSAFVYAATAYGDVGDFKAALPWADEAVEIVKLGHDGNSGNSAAYAIRGEVEGFLQDLSAADRDLTVAEDFDRKVIDASRQSNSESGNYSQRDLARNLQFHAKVLQALDRPDEAQKKSDEAAKYEK